MLSLQKLWNNKFYYKAASCWYFYWARLLRIREVPGSYTWARRPAVPADITMALTLTPLMCRIWWAPNNTSKWQMGFNPAFKGLTSPWSQISRNPFLPNFIQFTQFITGATTCHWTSDVKYTANLTKYHNVPHLACQMHDESCLHQHGRVVKRNNNVIQWLPFKTRPWWWTDEFKTCLAAQNVEINKCLLQWHVSSGTCCESAWPSTKNSACMPSVLSIMSHRAERKLG
jgi:hypothetical protein